MALSTSGRITFLARTNRRNAAKRFGIRKSDRLSHCYVIGKTGAGKTTLLENIAVQDIEHGNGLTLIDYHGDLVDRLAEYVPAARQPDLVYVNPALDTPYGYNPLRPVREEYRALAASGLMEVFRMQWGERAWGQRMEHVLRQALLALFAQPKEHTLEDALLLLRSGSFRKQVAQNISHQPVRDFWLHEYPKYSFRYKADAIAPIQSKVAAFLADPRLHRILTRPQKPLSFRRIMDEGKILLVNLSVGRLGRDTSSLFGGLLTTSIGLAALSRADIPERERRFHSVISDEFQHTTTKSVVELFPTLRKFAISMTIAHQYVHQIDDDVRHSILGNVGTIISFRLGAEDAKSLAPEFAPVFSALDLVNLPNHSIYTKLMIDGAPSKPFSADTLPPYEKVNSRHFDRGEHSPQTAS